MPSFRGNSSSLRWEAGSKQKVVRDACSPWVRLSRAPMPSLFLRFTSELMVSGPFHTQRAGCRLTSTSAMGNSWIAIIVRTVSEHRHVKLPLCHRSLLSLRSTFISEAIPRSLFVMVGIEHAAQFGGTNYEYRTRAWLSAKASLLTSRPSGTLSCLLAIATILRMSLRRTGYMATISE